MNRKNTQSKATGEGTPMRLANTTRNGKKNGKEFAKVTLYVRPDQVIAIEDIQLRERKRTGGRPDKSTLVQEALDLLVEKYLAKK